MTCTSMRNLRNLWGRREPSMSGAWRSSVELAATHLACSAALRFLILFHASSPKNSFSHRSDTTSAPL